MSNFGKKKEQRKSRIEGVKIAIDGGERETCQIAPFRFFLSRAFSTIFSLFLGFRCSFCQPASTVSLSLSLSRPVSRFSFDSSLSPFHVAYVTHSFRERFEFVEKKHNAEFLYEPGRRRGGYKGTETWCTKMEA